MEHTGTRAHGHTGTGAHEHAGSQTQQQESSSGSGSSANTTKECIDANGTGAGSARPIFETESIIRIW